MTTYSTSKDTKSTTLKIDYKTKCKIQEKESLQFCYDSELEELKKIIQQKYRNENFEILDIIGQGSKSSVYRIFDKKRKKELAIKYIKKMKKENIANEFKISYKLKHPNIISFYSFTYQENTATILMENCQFNNLLDFQYNFLKKRPFSESILCYISHQILQALLYCHKCKVAHMDIKPQNIVINHYLEPKLIDFSISIDYSKENLDDYIILPIYGTKPFMPLEILKSQNIKYKDLNKVDLYSLGATLYVLAFHKFPYDIKHEHNISEIIQNMSKKLVIKNNNNLSKAFIDFISKLLETDINKRINIYEAINHYWIRGAPILINERENICNEGEFFISLFSDKLKYFNEYVTKFEAL